MARGRAEEETGESAWRGSEALARGRLSAASSASPESMLKEMVLPMRGTALESVVGMTSTCVYMCVRVHMRMRVRMHMRVCMCMRACT